MPRTSSRSMTDEEAAEADRNVARREALVQRLCAVMGWEYKTGNIWTGLRKAAKAEATVIGLDKLEEILARLEAAAVVAVEDDVSDLDAEEEQKQANDSPE